ncbi:MAG TPA: hypothetical protein VMO17_12880 [Terriglobia bacterium]|nr:hypothetical protein [Terriglobia bacterium]
MPISSPSEFASVIGKIPYRMAFAGGWIDQPFVSMHNPAPPGAMVVVGIEPTFRCMDRSGMATSTREVARRLWNDVLPHGDPQELVRALYNAENQGKSAPSGSQDMAGLIIPGVSRLDYDFTFEGGYFPAHIETNNDPAIARWLERTVHFLPVAQRPDHYSPLDEKNLDREWIRRLGQSGKDCYDAILAKDARALGSSMNECMRCWEAILPGTVRHPAISVDLMGILNYYQSRYAGAMYSGCGGGYLYVVSEDPVPGSFHAQVRIAPGGDKR